MGLNANAKSQRALIWLSIVTAIIYGTGFFMTGFFPPPSPLLDSTQVAQLYTTHNLQLRIGVVICLIGGGFSLLWALALGIQMARDEKGIPVWATLQILAGTLGTILFVVPPLLWGVAAFTATRDPAITLLMHELAFLTMMTPISFFTFQALPVVVICFSKKADANSAFPQWLGYFSAWMLLSAQLGVIAQLFRTGPFAWNGLFTFWLPLSIFTVWFGVIAYLMLRAITRQQLAELS